MLHRVVVVALTVAVAGCFGLFEDRAGNYLGERSNPPLVLPEDLDGTRIKPVLEIPELPPEAARPTELDPADPRPRSLLATEVQYAKIQRLGDRTWLVIAESPAALWPLVRQFLADNGVRIEAEDAASGLLRTGWVLAEVEANDVVRKTLASLEGGAGTRSRLFLRVEAGIRPGTTEILLRQADESTPLAVLWPEASVQPAVEATLLTELGTYLAADVGGPAVSYLAQQIGVEGKSRLQHDDKGRPELLLRLDFDRAWATVGQALSRAEIEVVDIDRNAGTYYLELRESDLDRDEGNVVSRLFQGGKEAVQLQMSQVDGGYLVQVDAAARAALAERLLLVLQENSG